MQIYIVRTEVEHEVPVVLGYYASRHAAEERIEDLQSLARYRRGEGKSHPLNTEGLVIEEAVLGKAITPDWM